MKTTKINPTQERAFYPTSFNPSITKEIASHPCSGASLRRVKAESQSAALNIKSQIIEVGDLPLNKENAARRIEELDQMIAKASKEGNSAGVFFYNIKQLSLHVYLGNLPELVACLQKVNAFRGPNSSYEFESSSEEDGSLFEEPFEHALLNWAAGVSLDEAIEYAKFPDPITVLLFKATGTPLPPPASPRFVQYHDYHNLGREATEALYSRDYKKVIELMDKRLSVPNQHSLQREWSLQTRGFSKAMVGDMQGALQDYHEVANSAPQMNKYEVPMIQGLIHFLNNDLEEARSFLTPSYPDEITVDQWIMRYDLHLTEFAITKLLNL